MFLDHTQRRSTVGRTPLDERSPRRRDLFLTTHNTQTRLPSIYTPVEIRTHNLSMRAAADLRLRPRGHWERNSLYRSPQIHQFSRGNNFGEGCLRCVRM